MTRFAGLKALVVEDESIVALLLEDMLQELGCEIAASAARLGRAQEIAATAELDLAVLDVNLNGQPVFPVADILRQRRIPFLFTTGYGTDGVPAEYTGCPVLSKPFSKAELQQAMTEFELDPSCRG